MHSPDERLGAVDLHAHNRRSVELGERVRDAASGDGDAWRELVARFTPAIEATARGFRLNTADVEDVTQATWLAAYTHIHQLRQPEAIGGWLLVTARREAIRI